MHLIILTLLIFSSIATAHELPHLDLEMTGHDYLKLMEQRPLKKQANDSLDGVLKLGKRNLQWLDVINANRSVANRLELSNPALQRGIPIENPGESNRAIIEDKFQKVLSELPESLKIVLLSQTSLPTNAPIEDEAFLTNARLIDKVYQAASRWLLQEPYMIIYGNRSVDDIRGYYFLAKEPALIEKLTNWNGLDEAEKSRLRPWLIGQCRNSNKTFEICEREFNQSLNRMKKATGFYYTYVEASQKVFESYFKISQSRKDIAWDGSIAEKMIVPFKQPESQDVQNWLIKNIEEEWKWGGWQLNLDFTPNADIHIIFKAGATPNVNGLAGNRITMDSNRSIYEYTAAWTIRHEFGHVLGFPDCYVEFYDLQRKVMINYQIDTENIMCSRRGKIQKQHYEELKLKYSQRHTSR